MTPLESGLAAIDAFLGISTDESVLLVRAKCRGLLAGYDARWQTSPYRVDSVEYPVYSDLWNPETQRKSRSFTLAGLIDLSCWQDNRRVLMDHKTTSDDISDPNAPYWRQLLVEGQPSHYQLLEWLNGRKVDDCVWDVVRKPQISPKTVAKKDAEWTFRNASYFGRTFDELSLDQLRRTEREDLEMYEARLAHDCSSIRPQWYFQRRSIPRLDSEIHLWARELWQHSQDLLYTRRENRWPRNAGACMNYGRPCRFLGICSGQDTPDSDNWKRKAWMHAELPVLNGDSSDGRDILTNSRIRDFQTCRAKHYFDYELGIERAEREDIESLFFGSCWHAGMAGYFKALKEAQHGDTDNDSQANAVWIDAPALPWLH